MSSVAAVKQRQSDPRASVGAKPSHAAASSAPAARWMTDSARGGGRRVGSALAGRTALALRHIGPRRAAVRPRPVEDEAQDQAVVGCEGTDQVVVLADGRQESSIPTPRQREQTPSSVPWTARALPEAISRGRRATFSS